MKNYTKIRETYDKYLTDEVISSHDLITKVEDTLPTENMDDIRYIYWSMVADRLIERVPTGCKRGRLNV